MSGRAIDGDGVSGAGAEVERVIRGLRPHIDIVDGVAVATYEPQGEHRGRPGWLHGGFAATLLDHVCAGAATAALDRPVVTGRLDVRYPSPVPLAGGPYRIEAEPERPRGRIVRVRGAIRDDAGAVLVEARTLFVAIDPT
ncbi:MAG: PaaI family thioesterase [Actinomycetota bacterium]